jgi:flagellar biosynthesis chaperone FliJ
MPNPNPSPKTRYTSNRSETLNSKVTVRLTDSMYEKLKTQEDYREFIRQAIAEKLQSVTSDAKEAKLVL